MSLVEPIGFGTVCYVLGLITGASLIPWLVDRGLLPVRRHNPREPMNSFASDDCRWARQVAALLLIAVIVVIVLLDAVVDDYDARASVLVISVEVAGTAKEGPTEAQQRSMVALWDELKHATRGSCRSAIGTGRTSSPARGRRYP